MIFDGYLLSWGFGYLLCPSLIFESSIVCHTGSPIAWVNIAIPPIVIKQRTLEDPMRTCLIITEDTSVPPIPFAINNLFAFTIFNSANKTNQIL